MTLVPSKHNIVSRVRGREDHFAVNLLAGTADVMSPDEAAALARGVSTPELAERGYVVDPAAERADEDAAFARFAAAQATDEVQLFFAPTYACNFGCTYCYQASYAPAPAGDGRAVVDAFYSYVDRTFAGRRKYVTIFGGEPLLTGATQRAMIEALVDGAAARKLDIAVVTNGYNLVDYLDTLTRARIREIQVTLDGVEGLHDSRRPLKGGGATFDRVVTGIDATLERDVPVNLRVVVDRDNLAGLAELARFAVARGWTRHRGFKTQLGRNYDLHYCQVGSERLYSRVELHEALYELARSHPEVLELHRPAFSVSRVVAETGSLPEPLFDACPGCKTEWAFDYTGRIYPCTATVGKDGEELGTFWPSVRLDESRVAPWQARNVRTIPECRDCALQLACGGGCGSVAKNRHGRLDAPDCRPVRELLELGLGLYLRDDEAASRNTTVSSGCDCTGDTDARV